MPQGHQGGGSWGGFIGFLAMMVTPPGCFLAPFAIAIIVRDFVHDRLGL